MAGVDGPIHRDAIFKIPVIRWGPSWVALRHHNRLESLDLWVWVVPKGACLEISRWCGAVDPKTTH